MTSKIISFQIVQGFSGSFTESKWAPDVIALCEDGSLWIMSLYHFYRKVGNWERMYSTEVTQS